MISIVLLFIFLFYAWQDIQGVPPSPGRIDPVEAKHLLIAFFILMFAIGEMVVRLSRRHD